MPDRRAAASSDGAHYSDVTRIILRPVGSGLPLGFFSFSIGMLLLGTQSLGWIPVDEQRDVAILVAFVFPCSSSRPCSHSSRATRWERRPLGLFTASWLTLGWTEIAAKPGATSTTLGIYLFGFATVVLLLATLSTLGKPLFSALLLASAVRMVLSGVYEVGGARELERLSGGVALALTAIALHGGLALGLEDARQREVLPLFRRGGATTAFHGYERQLERLEAEAGVRHQL